MVMEVQKSRYCSWPVVCIFIISHMLISADIPTFKHGIWMGFNKTQ